MTETPRRGHEAIEPLMDAIPAIVIEPERACAAPNVAEAWVRESMRGTRSPRGEWTLRISFSSPSRIAAVLEDEERRPVAHRDLFSRTARECEGTMHAAGVWASLVLDAELLREHEIERAPGSSAPAASAAPEPVPGPSSLGGAIREVPSSPPSSPVADSRHVELGLGTSLGSGLGAPAPVLAGVVGFVFFDVWKALSMRASLSFATAIDEPSSDRETLRLDACARTAGHYRQDQGLQLDLCAGPETGTFRVLGNDQKMHVRPLFGIGPSAGLRGDLGRSFGVEIRGVAAYELVRGAESSDAALGPAGASLAPLSARAELTITLGVQ